MNQALYWPANADLIVAKEADWVTFFEDQHLETIVDPMVAALAICTNLLAAAAPFPSAPSSTMP